MLRHTASAADILEWDLPFGFPPAILYDGLLKRQRGATLDLADIRLVGFVAQALGELYAADRLFDRLRPDLVALSHAVDFACGALAWQAIRRGVPAAVLYGQ
ncbi:MAG: hypothetical protein IIA76_03980, partial [Proteobacteria bacterium]|nr:hypothetical protein [Pseudomonadota bacterium]